MPRILRTEVVKAARSLIPTRFQHQGRCPGNRRQGGIDCAGEIVCTGQLIGEILEDFIGYARYSSYKYLLPLVEKNLIIADGPALGRVVLFNMFRKNPLPTHIGILSDKGLIHAYEDVGYVAEHNMSQSIPKRAWMWSDRIHSYWDFKGVVTW